jgi:hypothetical protein
MLLKLTFLARFHGTCHGPVYFSFSKLYRFLSASALASQIARSSGGKLFHFSDDRFEIAPTCMNYE